MFHPSLGESHLLAIACRPGVNARGKSKDTAIRKVAVLAPEEPFFFSASHKVAPFAFVLLPHLYQSPFVDTIKLALAWREWWEY
jgi:hypothetical protein